MTLLWVLIATNIAALAALAVVAVFKPGVLIDLIVWFAKTLHK